MSDLATLVEPCGVVADSLMDRWFFLVLVIILVLVLDRAIKRKEKDRHGPGNRR